MRLLLQYEDDPALGRAAEFIPGQFMELSIPETSITRAYSLANTPNWDGTLEFLIRLQPDGAFSTYLKDRAAVGDALRIKGPQGSFTVDDASHAPRWFVAGGTGVAPMLSILRQMAEFGDARQCRLFFGVNRTDELFALDAIEGLKEALPRLTTTICVWTPGPDWRGFSGTPVEALSRTLEDCRLSVPTFMSAVRPLLSRRPKPPASQSASQHDRIFSEQFSPA